MIEPYIDMNTKLWSEAKSDFEKDFFKLINNAVFGKTMENARQHIDIRLTTNEERRSYSVSEPNYHTTKVVFWKFISNWNQYNGGKNK